MRKRFSLTDAAQLLLLLGVAVLVYFAMIQDDRAWKRLDTIERNVDGLAAQLTRVDRAVNTQGSGGGADGAGIAQLAQAQMQTNAVLAELAATLAATNTKLDRAISVGGRVNHPGDPGAEQDLEQQRRRIQEALAAAQTAAAAAGGRDTSWARPSVPIAWQPPYTLASDPLENPRFKQGGVFIECFEAQLSKLTNYVAEDVYARRIEDVVCDKLAMIDPLTLEIRGVLAEAWQYDPEGYWLRVLLRPDIVFSDGEPLTADDVVYTYMDHILNPVLETESVRSITAPYVETVEALSDRVVEFRFKQPSAFNLQLALVSAVIPRHYFEKFTPQQINESTALIMGTGPFKLRNTDWAPGQDIVLERNNLYWGPPPPLDELRFRVIEREEAMMTAFVSGTIDMFRPTSQQFVDRTAEPGWDQKAHSLNWVNMRQQYSFIGWQCGERKGKLTPFHDKRVRRAMTMLLDRERMIRDISMGVGTVAVGPENIPSPTVPADAKPWPHDPAAAKALLAEAGWIDRDGNGILENEAGQEFRFEYTRAVGGVAQERTQNFIVDACRGAGIICTPRVVEWSLYDQIMKTRDFDAITLGWSKSIPESDPSQIWHTDSIKNQGHNFIQWDGGQDVHINALRNELDFKKRLEHWHALHWLIHEEQPYTFLRVVPWLRFVDTQFDNVLPHKSGLEHREFIYVGN